MSYEAFAVALTEVSAEQREIILRSLKSVTESPHFSKSKRYPAFLEFVVLHALEQDGDVLKERTVGIQVFGRPANYDTSCDPVVRIAAGEVRRRLALYFSEHPQTPVWIDIPAGGYVAEFHFRPAEPAETVPAPLEIHPGLNARTEVEHSTTSEVSSRNNGRPLWTRWPSMVAVLLLLLAVVVSSAAFWRHRREQARQEFWTPLLQIKEPWQILVGKTKMPASVVPKNYQEEVAYGPAGPPNLVLDDAIVVGQICGIVRQYGRDCNIVPGQPARVEDLREKPVVVVGGFNNPWADLLLRSLPYTLRRDSVNRIRYVIEHTPAGDVELGKIEDKDRSIISTDYAIIAKFHSDVTDSVAVVISGVGIPGTRIAGQYVTSPEKLRQILSRAPKGWNGANVEAVLRIDVVQGTPGHAEVIAARFW